MFATRKITATALAALIAAMPASYVAAQSTDSAADALADSAVAAEESTQAQGAAETEGNTPAQTDATEMAEDGASDAVEGTDYEMATIEAFAAAVLDVTEIRDDYAGQLEGVSDETQQRSLIEEANAEMRSAIEEREDLTVEEYMEISRAAAEDEALNAVIAQLLQEMQVENAG
ncbi:hypothetical protein FIU97_04920 [Roseivivax sp. THAF40]|uniref:DUF4168 domain-containing protein n=1 Tax=unclassified Roseivivax TaxID=2639302 RepID=UPI0012A7C021|nr:MULTISPECIES: DUF4168 domain-containing protein [unclassified Roseivivax]QFS82114.1 hypothetical protein FIV09_04660 [Roseivivax sp. THAF197b]QFT45914.1 hypothetical protein FIU97_04920 [Roseivivax sp. THAF40]